MKRLKCILQLEQVWLGAATFHYRSSDGERYYARPAPSSFSRVAASCPLQAIQEQATLEDSPHVGQTHRRVHVLALQPLPIARARSAVRPASSRQRLRGTLRRQQPSSERRRRSRSPAACARYVTRLDPRTRQNRERSSSLRCARESSRLSDVPGSSLKIAHI